MNDLTRLLEDLVRRGLLAQSDTGDGIAYSFDDAIARQIAEWMRTHPEEREGLTEEQIESALGRFYVDSFERLAGQGGPDASERAADHGRYALLCLLAAQDFASLTAFAGKLVTGGRNPEMLGQVLDDLTASGVPVVFADYRLRRLLGAGSSAAVYEAERVDNALPVAVKVLRGSWSNDPTEVLRFLDEAKLANRVRHPNVVEVFDAGHTDGTRFLVMELLRGQTLERRWRAKGRRLSLRRVLEISMHTLGVLAAAHEKAIVHGSVRPSNIFILSDGGVKLLDFGMASLVRAVHTPGVSPGDLAPESGVPAPVAFLAPEQLRGELPDARTDLWSMGSTMLALLSGTPADPHRPGVSSAHLPGVPDEVTAILNRALRTSRDERWPTAQDMWEAIAAVHADLGEPGEHASDPGPPGSAPLVETYRAGPLSERIELETDDNEPRPRLAPSLRPPPSSLRPPAPASAPAPVPTNPRPAAPASDRAAASAPAAPVPLSAPSASSRTPPPRGRGIAPHEAARYLVPVAPSPGKSGLALVAIGLSAFIVAALVVLWITLRGGPDAPVATGEAQTGAAITAPPARALCVDGVKNGSETDRDCGGQCPPCDARSACHIAADCKTGLCVRGVCTACTAPTDCGLGSVCNAGICVTEQPPAPAVTGEPAMSSEPVASDDPSKKRNGQKCKDASECRTGLCTDGVCCDSECAGTCMSCNLPSFRGQCAEIPFGSDPDKECGRKVCDGDGACGDRKISGKRCKTGRECKSGFCVQGVCCSNECKGADATCATGTCKRSLLIE